MWQGIAFGLMAGAFWGTVFLAPRLLPAFSPLELSAARYLGYGAVSLVLLLPLWSRIRVKVTRADWLALLRLSLVGNIVYYLFLASAVQWAGIAPASLIVGVLPVTVTLIGSRDHGALKLRDLAWSLALIGLGILAINIDVFSHQGPGNQPWWTRLAGIVCAVGALASWTWYAVANARYLARFGHFTSQEWSLLTGVSTGALALLLAVPAFALPHAAGTWEFTASASATRSWSFFWLVNIGVAVGASIIGNSLWNGASRRLPLTLSGQLIVFETLFALLYGFWYEGRWPRPLEVCAIVFLIAGVSGSVRAHAKPGVKAPP